MRIALTGVTGFLGRYLACHLADAGHRLRCWYRPASDRSGFDRQADAIEWLPGELGDESATQKLVRSVDALIHNAVQWQGPRNRGRRSHGDDNVFFGVNLSGSLQLLQAAFAAGVARCIFISSCAVHEVILDHHPLAVCAKLELRRNSSAVANWSLWSLQGRGGGFRS